MQVAKQTYDHLEMLNPAQRQAAEYGETSANKGFSSGPLLVIAGAGTGKTMTLAHRVAHLVISGVSPERILLLTFTRRASEEMTRRVEAIVRVATKRTGHGGAACRRPALVRDVSLSGQSPVTSIRTQSGSGPGILGA